MKQIPLTRGLFALVDDEDYESLSKFKWCAVEKSGVYYAVRRDYSNLKKPYMHYMHRQLMGLKKGDKRQVDHADHHTLNNQRSNLRVCSISQNRMNKIKSRNKSSKYKGVSWNVRNGKWMAYGSLNNRFKYLGYFMEERDAAKAYDEFAKKTYKEFSLLNFQGVN